MRKIGILLLFICVACVSAQKNTGTADAKKISLNGSWNFLASNEILEDEVLQASFNEWDKLEVPGNWDTENEYTHFVGKGYYQRTFETPTSWNNKQIRLKFDAVYETSKVWLNGELLGTHKGGYTPFEFNISKKLLQNKPNSLVVMADNTFKRGAWWAWGGISRNVSLVVNEDVRLVHQHITAIPNFETKKVNISVDYKVENNSDKPLNIELNSTFYNSKKALWVEKQTAISIAKNDIIKTSISFEEDLDNVSLWHFDAPNLYQLKTALVSEKKNLDELNNNFGIRKLEVKGEQLVLNNEPIRVNGFNRVHDHRAYGNTEPIELIQQDILDMKALGGVFSRIMHAPASPDLLKFCDSIGYMIVEEIPVWGRGAPNAIPNNPITKQWLTEMIERDYNHPSVVGWSVGNEIGNPDGDWDKMTMTPDQYTYVNSMLDHIDVLDKTRLKTYASFTSYLPMSDLTNEPIKNIDFISINTYGKGVEKAKTTHEKFPGKPIFFSEIGGDQIGDTAKGALSEKLLEELAEIQKLPYVIGSSLWTYNDYRSNYKNTPASENRGWGVVDVWRNPKKAYTQIQQSYAPISSLETSFNNNTIEVKLTPRGLNDIPFFTLHNYQLKCSYFNKKNEQIHAELIPIPTIKPGDQSKVFTFKNVENTTFVKVEFVSPQGIQLLSTESILNETEGISNEINTEIHPILFLQRMNETVVIGYSVEEKDTDFTFQYGSSTDDVTTEFSTELKGSVKIPWPSNKPFFVKMKSNDSNWSSIKTILNEKL